MMKLTNEQVAIVQENADVKVNAVAGSGKTTTIIEYARQRQNARGMLYIAFNKSVKLEAEQKFARAGLSNVRVETAHSLAFKHVVMGSGYRVRFGYQTHELVRILCLGRNMDMVHALTIANHVNRFAAYFCNSPSRKVQELSYLDAVKDEGARQFVQANYDTIEYLTRVFLAKMDSGELEITHDFYLKKFQLSNPTLPYSHLLFDEGQDASAAMLDVFLKQRGTKLIVGDTHQQIYGWRYAINSLESVGFKSQNLSTSFRFNGDVAALAQNILQLKSNLSSSFVPPYISGMGDASGAIHSRAFVARTNISLLDKAIELLIDKKKVGSIYFEGNISSYTYGDEGTSLLDIIYLQRGAKDKVRDGLIGSFNDIYEFEEYVEETDDVQLKSMLEMVKKYGPELPALINKIKQSHTEDKDKSKADIVFSTVHRCKGMEYDEVTLANDFFTEEKLRREFAINPARVDELSEEVNLLYVAATRARKRLNLPVELRLVDYAISQTGSVRAVASRTKMEKTIEPAATPKPTSSYKGWKPDDDRKLVELYDRGWSITEISDFFDRSKGAIKMRLQKLDIF
ncbi:3'-5' exonuclease [Acetobacteroides hydrogenigenes]|uniref:DNA 3'-5' helicase n=1 Tax=Acetobacteroides hydrogenigenes TaxID=979970 RepID=A0A4R2EV80_9BACT|nr:3'-5' exonuclease [Acetobacteroides hydrogenigenes]TCN70724.1 AAA domain-containing protein [Acetobacteroides hydrogenigenes]